MPMTAHLRVSRTPLVAKETLSPVDRGEAKAARPSVIRPLWPNDRGAICKSQSLKRLGRPPEGSCKRAVSADSPSDSFQDLLIGEIGNRPVDLTGFKHSVTPGASVGIYIASRHREPDR